MQFRNKKNLSCVVITSDREWKLVNDVEEFGKENVFEDLQYSTTTREDGEIEYSVFIIYREKRRKNA